MADDPDFRLTGDEGKRIREEMRYALAVLKENSYTKKQETTFEKILSYLSNAFVLLLVGSLITIVLVPRFQQQSEAKKQKTILMHECFSQFLLYGNSIWQEYYAIFPLIHNNEIDKETYIKYIMDISQIKLRRYDAYKKVQALSIVYRAKSWTTSEVEMAINDYAIRINTISAAIDTWLRNLYCAPDKCITDDHAPVDPNFRPYEAFLKLQPLLQGIQEDERKVSELMVSQIKNAD